jgi:molybdopterin-guanine dinucleotide biosynthesis protein A
MRAAESAWSGITPVVLAGGRSARFGRDKLAEPLPDGSWLVDRPIGALRQVFGSRVVLAGACSDEVARRGDAHVADAAPGLGPIGGVLGALESLRTDIFVLPGDAPDVTPGVVEAILRAAAGAPDALAVLARTDRLEPCIGVYRPGSAGALARSIASGRLALHEALSAHEVVRVPIDPALARNVNRPADLGPPARARPAARG